MGCSLQCTEAYRYGGHFAFDARSFVFSHIIYHHYELYQYLLLKHARESLKRNHIQLQAVNNIMGNLKPYLLGIHHAIWVYNLDPCVAELAWQLNHQTFKID